MQTGTLVYATVVAVWDYNTFPSHYKTIPLHFAGFRFYVWLLLSNFVI